MNDQEFIKLIHDENKFYTNEELADIMTFKSEHIRVHIPARVFQIIAHRLRTGFTIV